MTSLSSSPKVVIDTDLNTERFKGFAKYLILEVYVDTEGVDSLKLYHFQHDGNTGHVT